WRAMDQCSLGDKGTLPSEMHLPSFPESQALKCSDTLNRDLGPGSRDLLYDGLSRLDLDPSLPMPDAPSEMLEDNLDAPSLYSGKDGDSVKLLEERADPESQTSLRDLGLGVLKVHKEADEGGRATSRSTRKGKRQHNSPQNPLLDCSLCGKVFSSASSLSKHYLTHSQERRHVCKTCSKAFKRQDHLYVGVWTGHMLTHQKTKPFVCIEQGCSKSYCDYRSLRRHYEVQHGLCILKEAPPEEEACGSSPHAHEVASQPAPASLTPAAPGALGTEVPEEPRPPQKEPATDVSTAVHSRAAEDTSPDPAEPEPPLLQPPFQWLRNLSGCPKSKGNSMFVVHKPSAVPSQEGSEPGPGLSSDSPAGEPSPSRGTGLEDTPPFPPTLLKTPGEASGDPSYASTSGEDDSWASKKSKFDCDSFSWQNPGEPGPQDGPKSSGLPSDATPLLRQLFLKSQESLVSHEQMQVFQMITKSQRIFSHTQPPPMAPTVDSLHAGPVNPEPEGSLARRRKSTPAFPTEASPGSVSQDTKGRAKVAATPPALTASSLDPPRNPDISSLPKQLRSSKGTLDLGDIFSPGGLRQTQLGGEEPSRAHLPGKQAQAENGTASGATKGEKGPACSRGGGYRPFSGNSRAQRFSGFRKEKVKMDTRCAASPSQVAMASFSSSAGPPADPPWDSKSKLTIFNRIQGGSIYRLPHPMKEENMAGGCHQHSGGPTDWAEPRSTYVCKNCSQMFYTEKGLSSHMCFHSDQWPSPRGKQEPQVFGMEFCKPPRQVLRPEGDRQSPPGARKPLDNMTAAPLVVPVSGQGKDGEERDSKESSQHRKRKKLPRPKAPLIPPPPSTSREPGPGGCRQSWLRSPVLLVDRLLKGLSWCPPYTPPPMLSPIREGSGLYFNTLYHMDGSFGICVVKDDTKISTEPHINIGSRFQAEIPELQDRSLAGTDEHVASLVWKPWGDVMTNPETQDRVTKLCNVACSSAMPGGGTNLELALHCLHEAQGNIQVALETLLLRGPQKPWTHPLANYRYTGSDIWNPMEKRLFKKAFCAHKKDFYLIHKTIQTKTVAQCVEYYYIWKKMIKFDCGRAPVLEKRRTPELPGSREGQGFFPCRECERYRPFPGCSHTACPQPPGVPASGLPASPCSDPCVLWCLLRVFDKIKSRNAHMKRHRLQDHVEPIVRARWPVKPFQLKEEEEEEEEELGADIGPLQW
ncbi:hypothetical protein E2I00_014831, partial [Balaenoptera physalus]